jgi:hypothetical protein
MISILTNYLVQHKSVSIPGLGTIYIERTPAQSDFVNRQILPPSYHYRFDKYFDTPDRDFFNFLAAHKGIADFEAIKLYNEWALEFKNSIRNQNSVEWENVGTLSQDVTGEIVFEPKSSILTFQQPVPAERVLRTDARHTMLVGDKERTNVEMTEYLHEEPRVRRKSWWIYALIIGTVALAAIFYHFSRNGWNIESTGNHRKVNIR